MAKWVFDWTAWRYYHRKYSINVGKLVFPFRCDDGEEFSKMILCSILFPGVFNCILENKFNRNCLNNLMSNESSPSSSSRFLNCVSWLFSSLLLNLWRLVTNLVVSRDLSRLPNARSLAEMRMTHSNVYVLKRSNYICLFVFLEETPISRLISVKV